MAQTGQAARNLRRAKGALDAAIAALIEMREDTPAICAAKLSEAAAGLTSVVNAGNAADDRVAALAMRTQLQTVQALVAGARSFYLLETALRASFGAYCANGEAEALAPRATVACE